MDATVEALRRETGQFFRRHWNVDACGCNPPEWRSTPARFTGSVPCHDMGGCYALVEGGVVVYIGLGASHGGGLYPEHGISRRLLKHAIRQDSEGRCEPQTKWSSVTEIWTIGFGHDLKYIALALEDYLIGSLGPRENAAKKRRHG